MTDIVIVTGCRDWTDAERVAVTLYDFKISCGPRRPFEVYVGDCPSGADKFARDWCEEAGVGCRVFVADWKSHGRSAGPKRNAEMVRAAIPEGKRVIGFAFWDGRSRGTLNCITEMALRGVDVRVVAA